MGIGIPPPSTRPSASFSITVYAIAWHMWPNHQCDWPSFGAIAIYHSAHPHLYIPSYHSQSRPQRYGNFPSARVRESAYSCLFQSLGPLLRQPNHYIRHLYTIMCSLMCAVFPSIGTLMYRRCWPWCCKPFSRGFNLSCQSIHKISPDLFFRPLTICEFQFLLPFALG